MLILNRNSRSTDQKRHVNNNSSSASFFPLDKDYGPREYDKSNKTLSSTQTSPLYPVNNVTQSFLSNKHLTCQHCNKTYKTETGLKRHKKETNLQITTNTIHHLLVMITIQQFPEQSNTVDCKTGNTISSNSINIIYDKVVFWLKNLFLLPSGFCGKRYIQETARLLNEWIHGSPLHRISFKKVMLMPNLLIQKLSKNSKLKDHQLALARRLELFKHL